MRVSFRGPGALAWIAAACLTTGFRVAVAQVPAAPVASADSLVPAFFKDRSPLAFTLVTDLGTLKKDRSGDPQWQPMTIRLAGGDSVVGRVRTRGIFRRRRCELPPLRLDVPRGKANATPLAGLDKPKLVVHCGEGARWEQYVVQEYLLYRVYELLTPVSQKARLVRVTYLDPRKAADSTTRYAIVLEEDEDVAKRTGLSLIDVKGAGPDDLDSYQSALVGVYQYLIGNTDWSATGLHNIVLLQNPAGTYPMAYDFDFAGAIETTYATVDPRLGIRDVRERVYRGFCTREDRWAEVFAHVGAQKDAIWALYRDEPALDPKVRARTLQYFEEVFRVLEDPREADRQIARKCRR